MPVAWKLTPFGLRIQTFAFLFQDPTGSKISAEQALQDLDAVLGGDGATERLRRSLEELLEAAREGVDQEKSGCIEFITAASALEGMTLNSISFRNR